MTPEQWIVAIGLMGMLGCFWYISQKLDKANARIALIEQHLQSLDRRGIYRIVCVPTGATYFGSTRANFMARWGQHVRDLDNGRHVNRRLQEDWNCYGRDVFSFVIVEVLDDDEAFIARENEILDWRAMNVAPALNYNQNRSRTYPVPAPPEVEPVDDHPAVIVTKRRPQRVKRQTGSEHPPIYNGEKPFSLTDLGLTSEEIAAIEQA